MKSLLCAKVVNVMFFFFFLCIFHAVFNTSQLTWHKLSFYYYYYHGSHSLFGIFQLTEAVVYSCVPCNACDKMWWLSFFSKGCLERGQWFRVCETDPFHAHFFRISYKMSWLAVSCCNITVACYVISSIMSSSNFLHSSVPGMPTCTAAEIFSHPKTNEIFILYYKEWALEKSSEVVNHHGTLKLRNCATSCMQCSTFICAWASLAAMHLSCRMSCRNVTPWI